MIRSDNVRGILECADKFTWSLQGFGMLRCYLSERVRLHVWDSRFAVPGVSIIHDHPWSFESTVISGRIVNKIYRRESSGQRIKFPQTHKMQEIRCGEGGGLVGNPLHVALVEDFITTYGPGQFYMQRATDLHSSHPDDGTVTLVVRDFRPGGDREKALVCYDSDEWVSAEPRPASKNEICEITSFALDRWTGS